MITTETIGNTSEQAASVLEKWVNRLNAFVYSLQKKKKKPLIIYEAKALADLLWEIRHELLTDQRNAESAMGILHTPQGRAILDACVKAGY